MGGGLGFEWHDQKAAENVRKHGVRFETATRVFDDPMAIYAEDDSQAYGERREIVIGAVDASVLFVVFVERRADVMRIISARLATAQERRRYANG
ncbi:MAG: hypothetical protein ABS77_07695 [Phenylobacterium sp. SCN 69-14]|nr:MAG: hypothetical protein ABS77_07695 [Phenylobacterium sp. SCN 69-14]